MRKITLSAVLLGGVLFAAACEGPETNDLLDVQPTFGTVPTDCDNLAETVQVVQYVEGREVSEPWVKSVLLNDIYGLIDDYFKTRSSVNAAHSHIENTARKVCDGDYEGANKMAWSFILQVDQQLEGGSRQAPATYEAGILMTKTFALVWDLDPENKPLVIPEGTFEATGGIAVINTKKGGTALARNLLAAAVVDPDDYPSGDEVYIVLSRTPDAYLHMPGFTRVFPAGYWIMGSEVPVANPDDDGILVVMCLEPPVPRDYKHFIRLAHQEGDEGTPLSTVWDGLPVDCSQLEASASADPLAPAGWLNSVGRFASTTLRSVFGPALLWAQDDPEPPPTGGVGLGGRVKSFSPFAPVDIYSSLSITVEPPEATIVAGETVELTAVLDDPYGLIESPTFEWTSTPSSVAEVDELGVVTGRAPGEATITATLVADELPDGIVVSGEATITVLPPPVLEVTLDNQADMSKEFRVTWTPSFGEPTECIADPRTTTACYPSFPAGERVTFTAETLWPTLPNSNVPGFDIWIEPGGDECPEHQQGSGFATCVFTMPSGPATIRFSNTNGGGG